MSTPTSQKVSRKSKRLPIPARIRYAVWRAYCGNQLDSVCFCCQCLIHFEDWHCGHIVADRNGGQVTAENLRPICKACNWAMGTRNMFDWMRQQQKLSTTWNSTIAVTTVGSIDPMDVDI